MPSRVSARASSAASARKSSAPPADKTVSTVFIPAEPALPTSSPHLRKSIVEIFADAQRSATGHRKLVVRLRKIQEGCCGLRQENGKGKASKQPDESINDSFTDGDGVAEKEFNIEVSRCMLRVLGVKKTEGAGDRVIKFLGTFLRVASEKDFELFLQGDPDETQSLPETPTSRLIFRIVSSMIPLLGAKERIIRYRASQIVTHIVNSLDSVDDELYHLIRQGLVKRIRDKEPSVRVQAVMGLGRLAGNEDEDDDSSRNDGAAALLDKLLDVLQNDTSAEVRRTLLLNLPLTPTTLPYLLERARDLDAPTRRALYSRLLPQLGDFRHLSLSMREKLLRWGIRDRDENVKKAAGRLFYERWIEDCAGRPEAEEDGQPPTDKTAPPSIPALMELLERIDVVNSGIEGGIAHEAMRNFWEGRPDYREAVDFNEQFWESLTPETVFMARSFNDFCIEEGDGKYDDLADEKIPEVTALAYYLHKYTTALIDRLNRPAQDERAEEETVECEFVVEQLLHICLTLDYSDEVGRRKMFSLLRETLAVPNLPEEVTKLVVEVLRAVCGPDAAGESEFCGVVLEAVAEVHDTIVSEDSFVSAKSELSEENGAKSKRDRPETPDDEDEEHEAFNFSHMITELSFGPHYSTLLNPLDKTISTTAANFYKYQYYMSIVPTIYTRAGVVDPYNQALPDPSTITPSQRKNTIFTNQYAVTSRSHELPDSQYYVPGIFFKYSIEPILLVISEERGSLLALLVRLVNVMAGVVVAGGWLFQINMWALDIVKKRQRRSEGVLNGKLLGDEDE
ncbi:hypothetical protein ACJ72_07451 [Emergomyces africanus]|uniref:Endoplasmic reticulum vesicle transporter C-terminal domain-containing protein n=1 Tax=Emergomyces africanus TaxID=1955775 RepID=A0A1B7NN75_9EURO|nr:hypothetical protein ACJ72_07451 [Emergomyces africanus]